MGFFYKTCDNHSVKMSGKGKGHSQGYDLGAGIKGWWDSSKFLHNYITGA